MPDYWMEQSVNSFIANNRTAPMLKEFIEKVSEYEDKKKREIDTAYSSGNMFEILQASAKYTKNKEFAAECLNILKQKIDGKLTEEQFKQACDVMDIAAKRFNPDICKNCNNSGYYTLTDTQNKRFIYRCGCSVGLKRHREIYGSKNSDGERMKMEIPIYRDVQ